MEKLQIPAQATVYAPLNPDWGAVGITAICDDTEIRVCLLVSDLPMEDLMTDLDPREHIRAKELMTSREVMCFISMKLLRENSAKHIGIGMSNLSDSPITVSYLIKPFADARIDLSKEPICPKSLN